MQPAFCKKTDIQALIRQLPMDQINHMSQVGIYVNRLAQEMAALGKPSETIPTGEYRYFGKAASYHDVGKVLVPNEILSKPAKLTKEEMDLVRKHTLFALNIFQSINSGDIIGVPEHLIPLAYDSAVYHHEWWNGKGYPFCISGEDIPLIARVTAICDAYDVMTSDRTYCKKRCHSDACRELAANAGAQFDPAIVNIFINNEAVFSTLCTYMCAVGD